MFVLSHYHFCIVDLLLQYVLLEGCHSRFIHSTSTKPHPKTLKQHCGGTLAKKMSFSTASLKNNAFVGFFFPACFFLQTNCVALILLKVFLFYFEGFSV